MGAVKVPTRRKSLWVFWLSLATSVGLIAAVVLLANDKRNLKQLLSMFAPQLVEQRPANIDRPLHKRGRPLGVARAFPPALFLPGDPSRASTFLRLNAPSGRALCEGLRERGIPASAWGPGGIGAKIHECIFEAVPEEEGVNLKDGESLFLMVRGRDEKRAETIRLKVTLTSSAPSEALARLIVSSLDLISTRTKWHDIGLAAPRVLSGQPFKDHHSGLDIWLVPELTRHQTFNLLIRLKPTTPIEKRTFEAFSIEKSLPRLPDLIDRCLNVVCAKPDRNTTVKTSKISQLRKAPQRPETQRPESE